MKEFAAAMLAVGMVFCLFLATVEIFVLRDRVIELEREVGRRTAQQGQLALDLRRGFSREIQEQFSLTVRLATAVDHRLKAIEGKAK
jgi:hypothetical protein